MSDFYFIVDESGVVIASAETPEDAALLSRLSAEIGITPGHYDQEKIQNLRKKEAEQKLTWRDL